MRSRHVMSPSKKQKITVPRYLFLLSLSLPFSALAATNNASSTPNLTDSDFFYTPWEHLLSGEDEHFSARLSLNAPLSPQTVSTGQGAQGQQNTLGTLVLAMQYTPLSYWFINASVYHYLRRQTQNRWDPDYSYSFGYDDWHPNTLSLVYGNYGGNRFSPAAGEKSTEFSQGTWTLSYKFPLAEELAPFFLVGNGDSANCRTSYNYTNTYSDNTSGDFLHHKQSLSAGCRYSFLEGYYIDFSASFFPRSAQQQPWDSDYTYTIGYSGSELGGITIQYINTGINRFPWNNAPATAGKSGIKSGTITLSWAISF